MDSIGGQGERDVQLRLQYSGNFSDSVVIGNSLSVIVVDDDREFNIIV